MKFCLECGGKLNADAVFCMNCGASTKVAEENTTRNEESPQVPQENIQVKKSPPSEPQKPMSKAKKITIAIVAMLGIGLIGTHLFLTNYYDPMKKIDAMNEAFNKKEKATFYEYFEVPKDTIANADQLYAVVQDMTWQDLRSELVYEIDKIKEKRPNDPILYNGDFLYLDKKPVLFGLYKEVTFNLIPTEVSVQLPFENMNVTIAGQTIQSESDDEIIQVGNFIPGTYEWSYELEKNNIELSDEGSISIYQDEYNQTLIDIDWGFKEAYLYSELEDAILYVNGQSTEKNVQELSRLYPVSLNGKNELHLVAKDGEGKELLSDKVKLDHEEIDFTFPHLESEKASAAVEGLLRDTFYDFRYDYENAIDTLEFDYIAGYFKENSEIQKDYKKFVEDHKNIPGYYYNFMKNDITSFKKLAEGKYELTSYETFYFRSDEDGGLDYERTKQYIFIQNGESYYIDSIENLTTKKNKS